MTLAAPPVAARRELFRGRTVFLMIAVGVLAFAALMVLSTYAPNLRSGNDGQGHALSKSAVGYAGAAAFFKARGRDILISRGPLPANADEGLLILTPSPGQEKKALDTVTYAGARLIVLPKWLAAPHPTHNGWVTKADILPGRDLAEGLVKDYGGARLKRRPGKTRPALTSAGGRLPTPGPVDRLQTLQGKNLKPLIYDDQGGIVLAQVIWPEAPMPEDDDGADYVPEPPVTYILSDPDLLNTQGLKSLDTARAADGIMSVLDPQGPLIFDVTLHGLKRSRNILAVALEPPFLGGTLCAVAAALLAGIGAAIRFGPVRLAPPPYAMGKTALVANTAGLIRMARREHRMAEGYARLCRELAARAVGAPRQLEADALDAFLDRLGAQRGAASSYSDLIAAAREAKTLSDLMSVARKLYDWRLEMTRESR